MSNYSYTIINPLTDETKDGTLIGESINEILEMITSLCPKGWTYLQVIKEAV